MKHPPRIHLEGGCDHCDKNVCPECAGLSEQETEALREYFRLLELKRRTRHG